MKYLLITTRFVFYISLAVTVLACADKQKDERLYEDVQAVFDQHKLEMQEVYRDFVALRSDLGGRTVFEITILPSGRVAACKVQSSDIAEPKFGEALCTKILSFDFGRKNMDAVTVIHWLDFYAP